MELDSGSLSVCATDILVLDVSVDMSSSLETAADRISSPDDGPCTTIGSAGWRKVYLHQMCYCLMNEIKTSHGVSFGYTVVPDDCCIVALVPNLNRELMIFCIPLTCFFN